MGSLEYRKLKQMIVYSIVDSEKWKNSTVLAFIQISNSSILVEVIFLHLDQFCEEVFVVGQELFVFSGHQHFKLVVIIQVACQVDCVCVLFVESFFLTGEEHKV